MLNEQRNVLDAFPQRRYVKGNHRETIVQILQETTVLNGSFQVDIGRGQNPYIHPLLAFISESLELSLIKNSQQSRLVFQREASYLIEKDGPLMSELESACLAPSPRARECTRCVTEQFALEE